MQAYGAGQFYPGMPGGQFVPPQQQPAGHGYGAPAAGGYASYAPPPAAGWSLSCISYIMSAFLKELSAVCSSGWQHLHVPVVCTLISKLALCLP